MPFTPPANSSWHRNFPTQEFLDEAREIDDTLLRVRHPLKNVRHVASAPNLWGRRLDRLELDITQEVTEEKKQGWFDTLATPFRWVQSGVDAVGDAVSKFQGRNITVRSIIDFIQTSDLDDIGAIKELVGDYTRFKEERASQSEATQHPAERLEWEKRAKDLYERRKSLTPREKEELQALQVAMRQRDERQRLLVYARADSLLHTLMNLEIAPDLLSASRPTIDEVVKTLICDRLGVTEDELTLMDYSVIELVTSKILLMGIDTRSDGETQHIAFLAAAYKEHNRLKTKEETYTGEDFLRVKLDQLTWLFDGIESLEWTLTFVDDQPKEAGEPRTIDRIDELLSTEKLSRYRGQVQLLDYDRDLKEEIALYRDEELQSLSGDDFARVSTKGGAVQVGLRYLSQVVPGKEYPLPAADTIIYTDCDTSIHLGNSGILLNQIYNEGQDIGIGSRRIGGAHVIGKSAERHLQSFVFNSLVRLLFNLQVTDTQVGAKAIRAATIRDIHSGFSEMSMAFDPELLKLASLKGAQIGEDGVVWIDSVEESLSQDQGMPMLEGLLASVRRMYPAEFSIDRSKEGFERAAMGLSDEGKLFNSLLSLAVDKKWAFLVKNIDNLAESLQPQEFRALINSFKGLLYEMAQGNVSREKVQELFDAVAFLVENLEESDAIPFAFHEFPQLFDIIELLQRNPQYATVIAPMLFGQKLGTSLLSDSAHPSLAEYGTIEPAANDDELFINWVFHSPAEAETVERASRQVLDLNMERLNRGKANLQRINKDLADRGETLTIGIMLQYNMDATTPAFIDKVLRPKIRAIREEYGGMRQIHWDIVVVDNRPTRNTGIGRYIDQVANNESFGTVKVRQLELEEASGKKALAVRAGLSEMAEHNDFVAFADLSDKIDIREMSNLVAQAYQTSRVGRSRSEAVVIGSRRLEDARVENKPITFLLRSMGLNLLVKAMFPKLFSLSDTQTGFKLFTKGAWNSIAEQGLEAEGLAFDIEILQQAAKLGLSIEELPVDFYDSMQGLSGVDEEYVSNMFEEVLTIRSRIDDSSALPQRELEARLLGGGAENIVYKMADGSIIKVPHELIDSDFLAVVKNFLLKGRKQMSLTDQDEKLITTSLVGQLLASPRLSKYVPALRSWKDLNVFVMKMITAVENKDYKSMGYHTAQRLGHDLVIPFRFVEESFSCEIEGKMRTFPANSDVKQSLLAERVFKDRFAEILRSDISAESVEEKRAELRRMIDESITLFKALWKRGLYDLDTNFMCDTGYFLNSKNQLALMVLDPGELIDDLSIIDIDQARALVRQRYDYIEMGILLKDKPEELQSIVDEYEAVVLGFLDEIEEDLMREPDQRLFGSEQRAVLANGEALDQFIVQFPGDKALPAPQDRSYEAAERTRKALKRSAIDYQVAYRAEGSTVPALADECVMEVPYLYLVPEGYFGDNAEAAIALETARGSVFPALEAIYRAVTTPSSLLVVADAGSATRSSNLKFASPGQTKGGIELAGRALSERAAHAAQKLVTEDLPEGYVVLLSSDDLMELSPLDREKIRNYFDSTDGDAPGMYWCDLPHGGADVVPLNREDMAEFFFEHAAIPERATRFLSEVPVAKGFARSEGVSMVFDALMNTTEMVSELRRERAALQGEAGPSTSAETSNLPIPGVGALAGYYRQFLMFNAAEQMAGMKTPFLMIFKKEFLVDFQEEIAPLLPNYTHTHITWEGLLVRGMKADRTIWMASGKPPLVDDATWAEVYDRIQALKEKYHIDTDDLMQNAARVFTGNWQNFDDPQAFMRFAIASYEGVEGHHVQVAGLDLLSDQLIERTPLIRSEINGRVALLGSRIEGEVTICEPPGSYKKQVKESSNLFYKVNLPEGRSLQVPPNHLVTQIEGEIYSVAMHEMSKSELKEEMVYRYNNEGDPEPYLSYQQFAQQQLSRG